MITLKKHIVNGLHGLRVLAGAAELGTIFYFPDEPGMAWKGVTADGWRFSARSKLKAVQRLQIHAAAKRGLVAANDGSEPEVLT